VLEVAADLAARSGAAQVSAEHVAEAAQGKTLLYDKAGDEHYGVISVFIKSMRGSDPDAAVYWMTRMLEAGEDPRFVLRRMVIFAAEDVGNADPQALVIATAALQAVELVGLPEGVLPMTQAVTYLALARNRIAHSPPMRPRASSCASGAPSPSRALPPGFDGARALDGPRLRVQVPARLRGPLRPEDYLPDELVGERIYEPSDSGFEAELQKRRAEIDAKKPR